MIKQIESTDHDRCAAVIRERFSTIAAEFGLTEQHLITGQIYDYLEISVKNDGKEL